MEAGIHELTAGYALDALDPEERTAFEAHLAGCARCREELASFWDVTSALAVATTGHDPRPELRERILAGARAEPQTVVPLRRASPWLGAALAAATALAAAVAIGLGIYAVVLDGRLDDTRAALAEQRSVASVLTDPAATTVALASGRGRVVVSSGSAVLVWNGVAPTPAGKTYQAWVIGQDGKPLPAGTFQPAGGRAVVKVGAAVPPQSVVAVTVEDAGGATTPTLPIVAASRPV